MYVKIDNNILSINNVFTVNSSLNTNNQQLSASRQIGHQQKTQLATRPFLISSNHFFDGHELHENHQKSTVHCQYHHAVRHKRRNGLKGRSM